MSEQHKDKQTSETDIQTEKHEESTPFLQPIETTSNEKDHLEGDYLVKALCRDGNVRAYALKSTQLIGESQTRHQTWATATAALGRTLSVGVMMGAMLKGEETITIQVRGNGPLGKIIVWADSKGHVRGYVDRPQTHLPLNKEGKLDVGGAVGRDGAIYVTKDLGLREPYHGYSRLISGEIGEDFSVYFAQSEQTPSAVGVGVIVNPDHTVKAGGGFIIQIMPGVEDTFITELEQQLASIPPISTLVNQGYSPEQILELIFKDEPIQWLEKMPVSFHCDCSKERVSNTLISLGQEELQLMIDEDEGAEVQCHFCSAVYHYDRQELEALLKELN